MNHAIKTLVRYFWARVHSRSIELRTDKAVARLRGYTMAARRFLHDRCTRVVAFDERSKSMASVCGLNGTQNVLTLGGTHGVSDDKELTVDFAKELTVDSLALALSAT